MDTRTRILLTLFGAAFLFFVVLFARSYAGRRDAAVKKAVEQQAALLNFDFNKSQATLKYEVDTKLASIDVRQEVGSLRRDVDRLRTEVRGMDLAAGAASRAISGTATRAAGPDGGESVSLERTANEIRVELIACRQEGNLVEVDFQIANVTDEEFAATLSQRTLMKDTNDDDHWPDHFAIGGKSEEYPRQTLAAGLPIGGTAYFTNVDTQMHVVPFFSLCITKGSTQDPNWYTFKNVPVTR